MKKIKRLSTALKEVILVIAVACLLGTAFSLKLLASSIEGDLVSDIQRYQIEALERKAVKISPEIHLVDLVAAKKLFDEDQAVFLDARSKEEYESGHISAALSTPILAVVKGDLDLNNLLPVERKVVVAYCSGGLCDTSVELAKELVDRGHSNIYVLGEGYPGWKEAGYPVEEGEAG